MSANASQRRARIAILSAPVAEYAAWDVVAVCRPCDRQVMLPAAALGDGTVAAGVRRLRARTRRAALARVGQAQQRLPAQNGADRAAV